MGGRPARARGRPSRARGRPSRERRAACPRTRTAFPWAQGGPTLPRWKVVDPAGTCYEAESTHAYGSAVERPVIHW